GTRKYALVGPESSTQSTPCHEGRPSGTIPPGDTGNGVHVLRAHARPPKQSLLVTHAPPTSTPPSALHRALRPARSQRSPPLQSASLLHELPSAPFPAGVHLRSGPQ